MNSDSCRHSGLFRAAAIIAFYEFEGVRKEVAVTYSRFYIDIRLEQLRKTTKPSASIADIPADI
jgi:hypothetical protein